MNLICKNIDLFDRQRDMDRVLLNEIQRFDQPMAKMFFDFLLKRYTNKYFFVVDLSCNGTSDAHLFAGENTEKQVHIFTIAVAEEFEGQGWGKKLIQHLFSRDRTSVHVLSFIKGCLPLIMIGL